MCSHSQIMNNKEVNEKLPILNKILSQVAHPAIRNKGTHGGSIAYGDPAAELPAFAVLTNAEIIFVRFRWRKNCICKRVLIKDCLKL